MIEAKEIDKFYRRGRGKVFQFYITDNELNEILIELQDSTFGKLELISSVFVEKTGYQHQRFDISDFFKLKEKECSFFFVRSLNLTPKIDLMFENEDLSKYFMYNGLIRLMHGITRNGYVQQSNIMFVDAIYNLENPTTVIQNKDYSKIFNYLKKKIQSRLKFQANHVGKNGKIYPIPTKNVSSSFKEKLEKGEIKSKIVII